MKDPMLDEDFLKSLTEYKHHHIWAKIISLNFDEYPLQEIEGKITSGSINIDGSSSVRRTCALSLVTNDVNVNDYYWGLKTKFKLEIGLENFIDPEYPDIIWFKQGVFLITSFSYATSVNSATINIQGKDKMVLLNGEMGGVIPASWDFATEDVNVTDANGNTLYDTTGYAIIENEQYPIKEIVLQSVHEFAQEPWQNIIVNDLDDYGIELLEYQGTKPFYYIIAAEASGDNDSREVVNMTLNENMECLVKVVDWNDSKNMPENSFTWISGQKIGKLDFDSLSDALSANGASNPPIYSYEKLMEQLDPSGTVTETKNYYRTRIAFQGDLDADGNYNEYTVAKITRDNGMQVCGYRICDIIYPYDLIAAPGDTLTSVLDKLVQMLGNFEYFYDVDGRFIFQKKRTYLDVSYNNIINEHSINNEVWANNSEFSSKYSYTFDGSSLLASVQNNPNFSNLKNDYSLWGVRQSGELEIPIHMRYAIDKKPLWYKVIGHTIKRDNDGNPIDENGNLLSLEEKNKGRYVYLDKDKIYCTEEGWEEYEKRLKEYENFQYTGQGDRASAQANIKLEAIRASYPTVMNEAGSSLRDWWKLEDWGALFTELVGEIPSNVFMSSGNATILDNTYYDTWDNLSKVFNDGYGIRPSEISVIDVDMRNFAITYASHGYKSCNHTYQQLINKTYIRDIDRRNNSETWVYDPRIWDRSKIREESSSIWTDEVAQKLYGTIGKNQVTMVDWREIIYQMANDYRRHYRDNDFLINVKEQNMYDGHNSWYPTGFTGYEQYYIDFEMNLSQGVVAYWRELYNPEAINDNLKSTTGYYTSWREFKTDADVPEYIPGRVYARGEKVSYQDVVYKSVKNNNSEIPSNSTQYWIESQGQFTYNSNGWNEAILNNPETLNFWFDFLDTTGELNKYSVHNIGLRSKATNDDKIKAIYFRETPNVIFETEKNNVNQSTWLKPGYAHIQIPTALDSLFVISSRGKNAMDTIEDYLYSYTYPASAITLTSVPIYHLTPNTLIYVNDSRTGIIGEYIMQKYAIQFGLNMQMSINAVETPKRIY